MVLWLDFISVGDFCCLCVSVQLEDCLSIEVHTCALFRSNIDLFGHRHVIPIEFTLAFAIYFGLVRSRSNRICIGHTRFFEYLDWCDLHLAHWLNFHACSPFREAHVSCFSQAVQHILAPLPWKTLFSERMFFCRPQTRPTIHNLVLGTLLFAIIVFLQLAHESKLLFVTWILDPYHSPPSPPCKQTVNSNNPLCPSSRVETLQFRNASAIVVKGLAQSFSPCGSSNFFCFSHSLYNRAFGRPHLWQYDDVNNASRTSPSAVIGCRSCYWTYVLLLAMG